MITKQQLKRWLAQPAAHSDLVKQIRESSSVMPLITALRGYLPDVQTIPQTTYSLYRQFEFTGERDGYQPVYFLKRSMLTRAVLEFILGDESMRDVIHDLLWSICEETTWVLPAHEEQGPDYWEVNPPFVRTAALGAHTMLTREPDSIDLFAAETGAALAEVIHLIGDALAPEVVLRVRQEVQRHIFKPYLAYARKHWWFKGALNWNGVCNGSIGLAFLRLEQDLETLAEALVMVLEGFEAYIATGFEADGGSIEGVGYWNYGLMYYVIVAELLRERSHGELDLLSAPRLKDIARYPVGMALSNGLFMNFGDATEEMLVAAGIVSKLAERTGVSELLSLLYASDKLNEHGVTTAKLPVVVRHAAWWDGKPGDALPHRDFYLPDCRVIKMTGTTLTSKPVILGATCGHNDGHHSHTDIASFIYHVDGESLIPDAGRGLYNKSYFRQERYTNIFNNSFSHNLPRFGDQLQAPGPEFNGCQQYYGTIVEHSLGEHRKYVVMDFHTAYDLPELKSARRKLTLEAQSGTFTLDDSFEFTGEPLTIEEALITWFPVMLYGDRVIIVGKRTALELQIQEPKGAVFTTEVLDSHLAANRRSGTLTRLAVQLPQGATRFVLVGTPSEA